MVRIALDTNILAYAEGGGDQERVDAALKLISELPEIQVLLPARGSFTVCSLQKPVANPRPHVKPS